MSLRVMVVEDDDGLAEALSMALEEDYEVVLARDGTEALDLLDRAPVDVIILDLMMPRMDGEEFMAEHRGRGGRTPVIVASAGNDLARRTAAMGAQDFIAKPYALAALMAKIARIGGGGAGGASEGGFSGTSAPGAAPDGDLGGAAPDARGQGRRESRVHRRDAHRERRSRRDRGYSVISAI